MKIKKVILKNFRQYIGEQTLTFSTDKDKNLTVIVGVNGAGKTNLLNAITWCYYGEEKHLVGTGPYHEILNDTINASLKTDGTGEVSVEVFLEDEKRGKEFRILRSKKFQKTADGSLLPVAEDFCAWSKTPPGEDWKNVYDPAFIVDNQILPSAVEDFFIFDGERLIKFFEEETVEKVKNAILDVSQISLIDRTLSHLKKKERDLMGEVANLSPRTRELNEKREMLLISVKELEEQIQQYEQEMKRINNLLKEVNEKLRGYSEERVKELQEQSESLEDEIEKVCNEIKKKKESFANLIVQKGAFVLASDALNFLDKVIEQKYAEGELPPKVRESFLRELLKKGKCICGSDISKGEGRRKIIEKLEASSMVTKLDNAVSSIKYDLKSLLESLHNFSKDKLELGKEIKNLEQKRESLEEKLRDVRTRLKELDIERVRSLMNQKEDYERQKESIIEKKSELSLKRDHTYNKIKELEHDIMIESRKEEKAKDLNKKIEICERAGELLEEIREEILEEVRSDVERRTFEYFHELIWKKEKFKGIKIDEDYNVSVIDRYNQNIIGALSAGEKEILALSFMAALSRISGFESPIIIDTPLARISGEHRINISECLPQYLRDKQLILLLTDKEYDDDVRKILAPRVGIKWLLQYDPKKDETRVVKYGS